MSHAANERLLRRLERSDSNAQGFSWPRWEAEIKAYDRKRDEAIAAVIIVIKFARMLAGTDGPPVRTIAPPLPVPALETAPRLEPSTLRTSQRIWTKTVRPGRDDVLSWDEAMRVPWIEGARSDTASTVEAPCSHHAWENWGMVGPPSYAAESVDPSSPHDRREDL